MSQQKIVFLVEKFIEARDASAKYPDWYQGHIEAAIAGKELLAHADAILLTIKERINEAKQ